MINGKSILWIKHDLISCAEAVQVKCRQQK